MINREIFDRVKAVIAQAKCMNMLYWDENKYLKSAESVDDIRGLPLLMEDCQTTAFVGGLVCYLATSEEITRAAGIYNKLSGMD